MPLILTFPTHIPRPKWGASLTYNSSDIPNEFTGQGWSSHSFFFHSLGYVYNYNETGVHRDITGWSECIAVQLVKSTSDSSFSYMWDAKLHEFTLQIHWSADRYV